MSLLAEEDELPARKSRLDRVGVVASVTCAVHCAATPLIMAASPALGVIGDERVEWVLFATVLAIGLASLLPSYLRRHHDPKPLVVFCVGVAVLLFARTQRWPVEMFASVSGALVVATAHLLNIRRTRACATSGHCHESHDHSVHDRPHPHGHATPHEDAHEHRAHDHAGHSH